MSCFRTPHAALMCTQVLDHLCKEARTREEYFRKQSCTLSHRFIDHCTRTKSHCILGVKRTERVKSDSICSSGEILLWWKSSTALKIVQSRRERLLVVDMTTIKNTTVPSTVCHQDIKINGVSSVAVSAGLSPPRLSSLPLPSLIHSCMFKVDNFSGLLGWRAAPECKSILTLR